jgi:inosose dehydratase
VADAGYEGVEASELAARTFHAKESRLQGLMADRKLLLSGGSFAGTFHERSERAEDLERLRRTADFLANAGSTGFIVFSTVPHPARRDMVAGVPPLLPLTGDRIARLADTLNEFSSVCLDFGLRGAVQNRVGTFLETPDEYQEVIQRTEPGLVWLAPDLGHWEYAGGDSATLIKEQRERIAYPRLKDLDRAVLQRTVDERRGFISFLGAGGFKELGQGSIDWAEALVPLMTPRFSGWFCMELEHVERPPKESAALSRAFLRDQLHV